MNGSESSTRLDHLLGELLTESGAGVLRVVESYLGMPDWISGESNALASSQFQSLNFQERILCLLALMGSPAKDVCDNRFAQLAAALILLYRANYLHAKSGYINEGSTTQIVNTNAWAVLLADLFLAEAFKLLVDIGNISAISRLTDTSIIMVEADVEIIEGNGYVDASNYQELLHRREGVLFGAALCTSYIVSGKSSLADEQMNRLGQSIGVMALLLEQHHSCGVDKQNRLPLTAVSEGIQDAQWRLPEEILALQYAELRLLIGSCSDIALASILDKLACAMKSAINLNG